MKHNISNAIFLITLFVIGGVVGYFSRDIYNEVANKRILDGLRLEAIDKKTALETAQNRDYTGDWVCVNIKGMDYPRAVDVCKHEVGHEIFAEICEKDIDKCFEVVNDK